MGKSSLKGIIKPPSDKSISHRAFIIFFISMLERVKLPIY